MDFLDSKTILYGKWDMRFFVLRRNLTMEWYTFFSLARNNKAM